MQSWRHIDFGIDFADSAKLEPAYCKATALIRLSKQNIVSDDG
jgi:hypothetical protein